jgi:hypothetical protein
LYPAVLFYPRMTAIAGSVKQRIKSRLASALSSTQPSTPALKYIPAATGQPDMLVRETRDDDRVCELGLPVPPTPGHWRRGTGANPRVRNQSQASQR